MSRAGDAMVDMAYFAARDDAPADYCQARVRECDVYAGLIGLRFLTVAGAGFAADPRLDGLLAALDGCRWRSSCWATPPRASRT